MGLVLTNYYVKIVLHFRSLYNQPVFFILSEFNTELYHTDEANT